MYHTGLRKKLNLKWHDFEYILMKLHDLEYVGRCFKKKSYSKSQYFQGVEFLSHKEFK